MADPRPGAIVHAEFVTTDLARTRRFLEAVFGWKFTKESMEGMDYWTFDPGSGPGGGITNPRPGLAPGTLTYVLVRSVDDAVRKITANGGKILMPKQEIPSYGWFAVFEAPGGIVQAVFEAAPRR